MQCTACVRLFVLGCYLDIDVEIASVFFSFHPTKGAHLLVKRNIEAW